MSSGMKLLDRGKLEAAYVTYSTIFDMALAKAPAIYPQLATVLPNAGPVNQFNWLGDMPTMRKWLGNRVINRLRAEKHVLTTDWYANGIEVDFDDVNEDKLGLVEPRIADLASMGPAKMDALTVDMYNFGFAGSLGLTYDGQYLFDTDHTADGAGSGAQQSNLLVGALTSANYNAGITAMMGFVGTNGEPLQISPDTLLIGAAQQLAARQLINAMYGANGASNVDFSTIKIIVNARITSTKWFLLALNHRIRPVLLGIEVPPMFAELNGWDQLHMFYHRTILAGAHMKVGTAYGMWQVGVGSLG